MKLKTIALHLAYAVGSAAIGLAADKLRSGIVQRQNAPKAKGNDLQEIRDPFEVGPIKIDTRKQPKFSEGGIISGLGHSDGPVVVGIKDDGLYINKAAIEPIYGTKEDPFVKIDGATYIRNEYLPNGEDLASQIKKDIAANVTSALQERLNNDKGILDSRWGYKGSSQPAFPETTVKMPYGVSVEYMTNGAQRALEIMNKHTDAPQTRKMIMVDNELRGQIEDAIFKLSCAQENALDASVFTRVSLPRTHANKIMDLLQELQVKVGYYE